MKITLADIRDRFDALISGSQSREEIASFAFSAMQAGDCGSLEMTRIDEDRIWRAITYVSGVDLLQTPDSYLHSVADFDEFRRNLGI